MTWDEMYEMRERIREDEERQRIMRKPERHMPNWVLERDDNGQAIQMALEGWRCTWGKWCTGTKTV